MVKRFLAGVALGAAAGIFLASKNKHVRGVVEDAEDAVMDKVRAKQLDDIILSE